MSEFTYTTEHRKNEKHGNADGLSRRACIECRKCEHIEQRDGGPSYLQLAEEEEGATLHDAGTPELAETRLRFAYQTIVGILQNDLVNSFHVFKVGDEALITELNQMLRGYLELS